MKNIALTTKQYNKYKNLLSKTETTRYWYKAEIIITTKPFQNLLNK